MAIISTMFSNMYSKPNKVNRHKYIGLILNYKVNDIFLIIQAKIYVLQHVFDEIKRKLPLTLL